MRTLTLLLVEDDEVDRMAVRRALRERGIQAEIVEAHDGQEALNMLAGISDRTPPGRPFIVLLDLNMPRVDGISFLQRLRQDDTFNAHRHTVVFVMTTSRSQDDIQRAYEQGISGYLVKSDYDESLSRIATLLSDFESVVEFPAPND
ncbi:MAG: response regulator [Rhodospirillaceae bacterium]|nr:response regulator [Rhodospirillaceae bacterium]